MTTRDRLWTRASPDQRQVALVGLASFLSRFYEKYDKGERNQRLLEQVKALFGEKVDEARNTVLLQRWQVAPNVYRFTLGEPLLPGEYALAEILPDGINLYVWDFGVDGSIDKVTKKK